MSLIDFVGHEIYDGKLFNICLVEKALTLMHAPIAMVLACMRTSLFSHQRYSCVKTNGLWSKLWGKFDTFAAFLDSRSPSSLKTVRWMSRLRWHRGKECLGANQ